MNHKLCMLSSDLFPHVAIGTSLFHVDIAIKVAYIAVAVAFHSNEDLKYPEELSQNHRVSVSTWRIIFIAPVGACSHMWMLAQPSHL